MLPESGWTSERVWNEHEGQWESVLVGLRVGGGKVWYRIGGVVEPILIHTGNKRQDTRGHYLPTNRRWSINAFSSWGIILIILLMSSTYSSPKQLALLATNLGRHRAHTRSVDGGLGWHSHTGQHRETQGTSQHPETRSKRARCDKEDGLGRKAPANGGGRTQIDNTVSSHTQTLTQLVAAHNHRQDTRAHTHIHGICVPVCV